MLEGRPIMKFLMTVVGDPGTDYEACHARSGEHEGGEGCDDGSLGPLGDGRVILHWSVP
jgi:hypothetical protein